MPSETTSRSQACDAPFPPEIIDKIIKDICWHPMDSNGILDSTDRNTLEACTLVSRSFRQSAQAILFAIINITFRDPDQATDILPARDPSAFTLRLQNLVTVLFIRFRSYPNANLDQSNFPALNTYLPNLKVLSMQGLWYDGLSWSATAPWFREKFYAMMRLPKLATLRMFHINDFPLVAFYPCSQLKHLTIEHCFFAEATDAEDECAPVLSTSGSSNNQGYLEVLEFLASSESLIMLLTDPSSSLSLMHIRKLSASEFGPEDCCQHILELAPPYLEDLSLLLPPRYNPRLQSPHSEILREVVLLLDFDMTDMADQLSQLVTEYPNLTQLTIRVVLDMRLTSVLNFPPHLIAGFDLLDEKLTSEPCVTKLKITRLVLFGTSFHGEADEDILKVLKLTIPRFLSTRRVELTDTESDPVNIWSSLGDTRKLVYLRL